MSVRIVPIEEGHAEGFHACLDKVAREKKFLAFQEGPPIDSTRAFVKKNVETGEAQFVALHDGAVVGWCDILRNGMLTFSHTGVVGMGLLKDYRGQGIGRRLLGTAIEKSFADGIERIELTVLDSNANAIALYRKMGFRDEGRLVRKAKLDGAYFDLLAMALFKDDQYLLPAV